MHALLYGYLDAHWLPEVQDPCRAPGMLVGVFYIGNIGCHL